MKGKRGLAISFMIIVGILFLMLMFFAYALRHQIVDIMNPPSNDASAIQLYVDNCVNAVSQYAIYKIGKHGGSVIPDEPRLSNLFLDVNYAFDGTKKFPSLSGMKSEIEGFVDDNLKNCTYKFRGFESRGVHIEEGDVKTEMTFQLNSVLVSVNYPLKITSGGSSLSLEDFHAKVPVRIDSIQSGIENFVSDFDERYDMLYLNDADSNIYITPYEETDLFAYEDLASRIMSENYLFLFAVR
jgi:hypothetical protein